MQRGVCRRHSQTQQEDGGTNKRLLHFTGVTHWMRVLAEMEKHADGADASVLFFLLGWADFLAVYVQII